MLKKNGFTIGVLALLLSFGLVGSAFAIDRNYIELDESDYSDGQYDFDANQTYKPVKATVAQTSPLEASAYGLVNLIELDESDYGDGQYGFDAKQTYKPAQATVVQIAISESSVDGWVNLIELDESDYEYAAPGSASKRVLCAGTGSTGQLDGC